MSITRRTLHTSPPRPESPERRAARLALELAEALSAHPDQAAEAPRLIASMLALSARPDEDLARNLRAVGGLLESLGQALETIGAAADGVATDLRYGRTPDPEQRRLVNGSLLRWAELHAKAPAGGGSARAASLAFDALETAMAKEPPLAVLGQGEYATVIGGGA